MNILQPVQRLSARPAWAATMLLLVLQRTPLLRVLADAEFFSGVRVAHLLRAALPVAALCGATHTLTGATQFTTNPASPVNGTVGQAFGLVFAVTGAQSPAGSYGIDGPLPAGLSVPGATVNGTQRTLNASSGSISGTPTQSGTFDITLRAFQEPNRGGDTIPNLPVTIVIAAAGSPPTFTTHPQTQAVTEGANVVFSVAVSGAPAPSLQWRKDTVALSGEVGATLALDGVTPAEAGSYDCVATNPAGTATSNPATLTVNLAAPAITSPPVAMTSRKDSAAFFSVQASGSSLTYQWLKNDVAIGGATASSLYLGHVQAAEAGSYAVRVSNSGGNTTSAGVALTVTTTGDARLANLSTRAQVGTGGDILIPGFVVTGGGSKNLLVRAVGPRLADFGVGGVLADPTMTLFSGSTSLEANDDWQLAPRQAEMETVRAAVFAFPLAPSTRDASLLVSLGAGSYTVQAAGVGNTTGVALVELYDADPLGNPARLANISARALVGTGGDILIPGFVIEGDVSLTLLVRGVGPRLGDFGVGGVLADPVMTVFHGPTAIFGNDDWGQSPNLAALEAATTATFAFPLNPGSADAAMLVALNPGTYTVQVAGKNATTGVALVELYLVAP